MTDKDPEPFWRAKRLADLSNEEWESLCDGCGKCCLLKVEYEDTHDIEPTSVACKLLDLGTCQCSNYPERKQHVPDCIELRMVANLALIPWLPETCAYRLVARRQDLHWWHHLVSGSRETVHEAGVSIRHKAISELDIGDLDENLQNYVVDWKL